MSFFIVTCQVCNIKDRFTFRASYSLWFSVSKQVFLFIFFPLFCKCFYFFLKSFYFDCFLVFKFLIYYGHIFVFSFVSFKIFFGFFPVIKNSISFKFEVSVIIPCITFVFSPFTHFSVNCIFIFFQILSFPKFKVVDHVSHSKPFLPHLIFYINIILHFCIKVNNFLKIFYIYF